MDIKFQGFRGPRYATKDLEVQDTESEHVIESEGLSLWHTAQILAKESPKI